jgi:hypothetical protein
VNVNTTHATKHRSSHTRNLHSPPACNRATSHPRFSSLSAFAFLHPPAPVHFFQRLGVQFHHGWRRPVTDHTFLLPAFCLLTAGAELAALPTRATPPPGPLSRALPLACPTPVHARLSAPRRPSRARRGSQTRKGATAPTAPNSIRRRSIEIGQKIWKQNVRLPTRYLEFTFSCSYFLILYSIHGRHRCKEEHRPMNAGEAIDCNQSSCSSSLTANVRGPSRIQIPRLAADLGRPPVPPIADRHIAELYAGHPTHLAARPPGLIVVV